MATLLLIENAHPAGRFLHVWSWWPTVTAVSVATVTDLRSRRIPNWLVFPFMAAGLVLSAWLDGWQGLAHSLEGFTLAAAVYGLFYLLGGMGMGDVKLCAGIGAWIGPGQMVTAMVMTAIAGGLMAVAWAVCGGFLGELLNGSGELVFGFGKRGMKPHPELVLSNPATRKMPYAPAIAIGTLLSFFSH